jgi:hypothetical protein
MALRGGQCPNLAVNQIRTLPKRQEKASRCEKDVKREGTNSISPLESKKVSKNELKTNWFLSAKKANQSQNSGP